MGEPVHTNLPWIVVSGDENVCINGRDGFVCIMDSAPPIREANAALIVDRVNGWDALAAERDALQARVRDLETEIASIGAIVASVRPELNRNQVHNLKDTVRTILRAALSPTDAVGEMTAAEMREACAKVCEQERPGFCGDDRDVLRYDTLTSMAEAIRALSVKNGEG